ncbi:phage tail protein [Lacinutrix jangbogonensis]|uniref:phage tail protein n=1 Tax=Lacinutrix jangbogonensis TaxID=1469557 RepID=UPI00053E3F8A|nr:tail fiber protein [Lacinutrix jangbogonensis]
MNPFIGEIMAFGGNFAPRSWAFCNGQLLAISQNTALFSILGTTYGGDGRTTFALPDLRGRAPIHAGTGPGLTTRSLGQRSGTETNTLNTTQLPSHNHAATGHLNTSATPAGNTPVNSYPAPMAGRTSGGDNVSISGWGVAGNGTAAATDGVSVTVGNSGGNQHVNNMQPWECINYIICLFGVYPSRN